MVVDPAEATSLVRRGPAVVLASGSNLDRGLARRLLLAWGGEAGNLVLLPQPPRVSFSRVWGGGGGSRGQQGG